jgi:hypothetical protein
MNDIVENKSFQEKMHDRIRESIGDLITDEELKKLIDRGMEEIFFSQKVNTDTWGHITSKEPALIEDLIADLMRDKVHAEIQKWMTENKELLNETIRQVIQEGIGKAVIQVFENKFSSDLYTFQSNIEQRLMQP